SYFIVKVKYFFRLYISRLSCRRLIMNQTFELALILGQNGNTEPSVTDRQVSICRPSVLLRRFEHLINAFPRFLLAFENLLRQVEQQTRRADLDLPPFITHRLNPSYNVNDDR